MKIEPDSQDIAKALTWYKEHHSHVTMLVGLTNDEFPPSGSDCHQPELWKAGHWKWLLTRDIATLGLGGMLGGIELTEREKLLIEYGLYVLECQCHAQELEPAVKDELNGTPESDEIRQLMSKFKDK